MIFFANQHLAGKQQYRMSTRIREFRKLRGMTLNSLAQKVGTTAQTIQRLETENMTVSLDWLERIADVFGIPAAALLVSDSTASVPILGHLNGDNTVIPAPAREPFTALSLVIAAPSPVAVRVAAASRAEASTRRYDIGTLLIGGKIEIGGDTAFETRDCLVAYPDGSIRLENAAFNDRTLTSAGNIGRGFAEPTTVKDMMWVAPILMAVHFF